MANGNRPWPRLIAWVPSTAPIRRWYSIARCWAAGWRDDRALVAGLHAFAQMDVPLGRCVEAEAVAQLLDADLKEPRLDSVDPVPMRSTTSTRWSRELTSDKRVQAFEMDPETFADRDQPRPRHTYVLLDRPMPETGAELRATQCRAWRACSRFTAVRPIGPSGSN